MKKLFSTLSEKFRLLLSKLKQRETMEKAAGFFRRAAAFLSAHRLVFAGAALALIIGAVLIPLAVISRKGKDVPKSGIDRDAEVKIKKPVINSQIIKERYLSDKSFITNKDGSILFFKLDTITPSNPILVKFGAHDERISGVQSRLMELWYMDHDEPTDYFGKYTCTALKAFQRANDLAVTGTLDSKTYSALFDDNAKSYMCSVGDSGSDVLELQNRLYELGYLEKITGLYNEETETAVVQFQNANALTSDGRVGIITKERLYDPDAKPNVLSLRSQGDLVLKCQNKLRTLGYLTTEPDGNFGPDTQMAVKRFQEQNSLIVDGYLGPTTRKFLLDNGAKGNALSYGMRGSDVRNVQMRLRSLNYLEYKYITGYYTEITETAVRLFQKNNSLKQDGTIGRNTMNRLFSESAVRAKKPVKPGGSGSVTANRIERFIKIARSKLGCPYVRGAKGPNSFDCSGFVYWCMNQAGLKQPYLTSLSWRTYKRYPRNNDINNVRRGDVVVYYGHVVIALGDWKMIDASFSRGQVVQRGFNSKYWHKNFICSYHIFGGKH